MIPTAFDYQAPTTVDEALAALASGGDDVKVMGGGQSLLPILRMRLNAPDTLVDLSRIEALRGIRDDGDALVIGAMTPYSDVVESVLVHEHAPLGDALARWVRRQAITDDWAGAGIALNAVAPGIIRTPMTADMLADERLSEYLHSAVPMPYGGVAEPAVVAELLAFLTSADARSITGQTVFVDGGADCVMRGDDVF